MDCCSATGMLCVLILLHIATCTTSEHTLRGMHIPFPGPLTLATPNADTPDKQDGWHHVQHDQGNNIFFHSTFRYFEVLLFAPGTTDVRTGSLLEQDSLVSKIAEWAGARAKTGGHELVVLS